MSQKFVRPSFHRGPALGAFVVAAAVLASFSFAVAARAGDAAPAGWRLGIGTSVGEHDPAKAGDDAAAQARKQFGEGEPAVVFVFAAAPLVKPALVEAVAKHFPAERIYGGQVAAPLTPETNIPDATEMEADNGVGVLAIGGDVDVRVFSEKTAARPGDDAIIAAFKPHPDLAPTDVPYRVGGFRLGKLVAEALPESHRPGTLVFTQGDQYTGNNRPFAIGLRDAMGDGVPIIGGASGDSAAFEIIGGKIVTGHNYAVLFRGDFRVGMALFTGAHTPATTERAITGAVGQGDGAEPFFTFIYNCRRRRQLMTKTKRLGEELAIIQKSMGTTPFFGGYGPGEIGAESADTPSYGTGFSVVAAALFALPAKGGE